MQVPNNKGELAVAVCPICNIHSICDPGWLPLAGKTLKLHCENCLDPQDEIDHLVVKFHMLNNISDKSEEATNPEIRSWSKHMFGWCIGFYHSKEEVGWQVEVDGLEQTCLLGFLRVVTKPEGIKSYRLVAGKFMLDLIRCRCSKNKTQP